ncbi:STAS domain-containing protein [Variovorax humicola]|uniref:STAS domain-containing protein n=1 Tax=Variovorax humicola TaxID=1769758 RepID=A0ABU8VRN7_9BURK
MAKEEPGRLLSKVAKFVRNPLKDWAELDEQDAGSSDTGYSREMLKEMIERRQRNDFVRRREFDMLRKLRQREASGGSRDSSATPSSFSVSTSGKTAGRALTLKKIDEIEEQMSQQWWKKRQQSANGEAMTPADMAAQQARAYADTEPGQAPPVPAGSAPGELNLSRMGIDSGLEEASIRFAHGDDPGAEAILLQTVAPESPQVDGIDTWRALLDFYRATGDTEKFVQASTRYAQRFKRPGPEWISLPALARDVQTAGAAEHDSRGANEPDAADWFCPQQLSRGGLAGLTQALSHAGQVWTLDWRGLSGIDADAAGPLRALMEHWASSPVQLRFAGAERLVEVLNAATPTNNRNTEPVWWQLRMAILRLMNDVDGFELTALNYCITYEVSPPPWEDPVGSYAEVDAAAAPAQKPSISPASMHTGIGTSAGTAPAQAVAGYTLLVGELSGECHDILQRLDAELVDAAVPTVSCAALVRTDFAAAGTLLNWVMARAARGQRVEFIDVHRMLAAFFKVIGIADHASVAVRAN